jgi:hypothetical protein
VRWPNTVYLWDAFASVGLVVGATVCIGMVVWFQVNSELGWIGLLFLGMLLGGMALHPRLATTVYRFGFPAVGRWLLFVLGGYVATAGLQAVVLTLGSHLHLAPLAVGVLTVTGGEVQNATLLLAGICETFFLFWFLQPTLSTFLHPVVGVVGTPAFAGFFHLFVYGGDPVSLTAVVGSFLIQSVVFEYTHCLSIPLGIHLCVNLLPLVLSQVMRTLAIVLAVIL